MNSKNHSLHNLKIGDIIRFPDEDINYKVHYVGLRFTFSCSDCGNHYTVVDKKEEILASTNMTFEEFCDFNLEGNAQKLEVLLTNGERELSRKYRDTFQQFNLYKGEVITV